MKKFLELEGVKIISREEQKDINGGVDCNHTHNFCDYNWGDNWTDYSDCMLTYDCYPRMSWDHLVDEIWPF